MAYNVMEGISLGHLEEIGRMSNLIVEPNILKVKKTYTQEVKIYT